MMPGLNPYKLAQWCTGSWDDKVPAEIKGVGVDSRCLTPGSLFVALQGESFDGHNYLDAAWTQGAVGAVVSHLYQGKIKASGFPLLKVRDPLTALQKIAEAYRQARKIRIVGITGSAGKTTVKEMLADVLATQYPVARTRGNWNNHIGLPLSLLNMPEKAEAGVFEIGINHPGEMEFLCSILKPDRGLITNVGPVHIENFNDEAAIVKAKAKLLDSLPVLGTAVLRADAPWFKELKEAARSSVLTIALADSETIRKDYFWEKSPVKADFYGALAHNGKALLRDAAETEVRELKAPLPGKHNLVNLLFAAATGRAWGVSWENILLALETYTSISMRWETTFWRETAFINDAYNANPLSMAAALETFAQLAYKRKWLVLGGMWELGALSLEMHRRLGRQAARLDCQGVITVGEKAFAIADEAEASGMPGTKVFRCATQKEAAKILQAKILPGDAVLLKGSRSAGIEKVLEALPPDLKLNQV